MSANDKQIGGEHYKSCIEPWDAITDWNLGYLDGSAVKYLSRWHKKGGIQDLEKAIHFLEKLIEVENERLRRASNADESNRKADANRTAEQSLRDGRTFISHAPDRESIASALRWRDETRDGTPRGIEDII